MSELAERAAREHYLLKRRPKCLTRQEATAAERGNAAHRAMQFADLAALKKDPKAEIERLGATCIGRTGHSSTPGCWKS